MSQEILVNIEEFNLAIEKLSQISASLESLKTDANGTIKALKGEWKGKTAKLFFDENELLIDSIGRTIEGMDGMIMLLADIIYKFEEIDTGSGEKIREAGGKKDV